MSIGKICNREVIFVQSDTSLQEAAQLMRQHHVGALVVVDGVSGKRQPMGLVTDRDLVVEVQALELDATVITVGDIMSQSVTVQENSGVFEAIQLMRDRAVRRLPVVDEQGELTGIVSLDDFLRLLSDELSLLSALIAREQAKESHARH